MCLGYRHILHVHIGLVFRRDIFRHSTYQLFPRPSSVNTALYHRLRARALYASFLCALIAHMLVISHQAAPTTTVLTTMPIIVALRTVRPKLCSLTTMLHQVLENNEAMELQVYDPQLLSTLSS